MSRFYRLAGRPFWLSKRAGAQSGIGFGTELDFSNGRLAQQKKELLEMVRPWPNMLEAPYYKNVTIRTTKQLAEDVTEEDVDATRQLVIGLYTQRLLDTRSRWNGLQPLNDMSDLNQEDKMRIQEQVEEKRRQLQDQFYRGEITPVNAYRELLFYFTQIVQSTRKTGQPLPTLEENVAKSLQNIIVPPNFIGTVPEAPMAPISITIGVPATGVLTTRKPTLASASVSAINQERALAERQRLLAQTLAARRRDVAGDEEEDEDYEEPDIPESKPTTISSTIIDRPMATMNSLFSNLQQIVSIPTQQQQQQQLARRQMSSSALGGYTRGYPLLNRQMPRFYPHPYPHSHPYTHAHAPLTYRHPPHFYIQRY